MKKARRLSFAVLGAATLVTPAMAQVPDLLNSLDAGSRSMGAGGSLNATGSDTMSSFYNPAGLGYVRRKEVGASMRNLPKTKSTVSGNFSDPTVSTKSDSGTKDLTHF